MLLNNVIANTSQTQLIRIGATEEPPYVLPCFMEYPNRCIKVGSDLEFIYTVIHGMLHLEITWVGYPGFDELQVALVSNEIDLIGNALPLDWQIVSNASYRFFPPPYGLGIGFFAKSLPVVTTLNPFSRFTWDLWACLISLTLCILLIKKALAKRSIVGRTSFKIFYLLWCFTLTLVGELYSNILTTDLITLNRFQSTYHDLSDLGDKLISEECRVIVYDKYIDVPDLQIIFNSSTDTVWAHKFKAAFPINPPITFHDKPDMYTFIRNSSCVVGVDFVSYDLSSFDNLCNIDVKIYPDDIPFMPYVYYHTLDNHTSLAIDNIFSSDSFRSYPSHLAKSYNDVSPGVCEDLSDNKYLLTLSKIYMCFAIYAVGIILSVIVHAILVLRSCLKYRQFRTQRSRDKIPSLEINNDGVATL